MKRVPAQTAQRVVVAAVSKVGVIPVAAIKPTRIPILNLHGRGATSSAPFLCPPTLLVLAIIECSTPAGSRTFQCACAGWRE